MSLKEPFWKLETRAEFEFVRKVLRRRFPDTYSLLEECLERADPFEIVYADNPGEYDDVVREIIVLVAQVNGALGDLPADRLDEIVRDGLARCFGELPDEERVQNAVNVIASRLSRG
jgi:hypothetical protein